MRCNAATPACVISARTASATTRNSTIMKNIRRAGIRKLRLQNSPVSGAFRCGGAGRYSHYPQERGTGVTVVSPVPWKDRGMNTQLNDTVIDEIVATCNGDIRGALKALMLVNEQLEAELQLLHAAFAQGSGARRGAGALH